MSTTTTLPRAWLPSTSAACIDRHSRRLTMTFRPVLFALVAIALLAATDAGAARFGGGRSFGAQRPSIAAPRAAPAAPATANSFAGPAANPVMPRTPASVAGATPAAGVRAPAATGSRWLGPLAGIAAGIGLATLMSHFGMSGSFSGVLLLLLLVAGGVMLVRTVMMRRRSAARTRTPANPSHWPAGFDAERFARQALQQFRAVQRAYDNGDTAALADVMTPELYTETVSDLRARGIHVPTVFETLDADVLDVATEADLYWVSVRFYGLSGEGGAATAQKFDEVWNLSKPVDGSSGWLVAGIQQPAVA